MATDPYGAYAKPIQEGPTVKKRATEANIEQSGASAGQSRASTERVLTLLPAEKREAEARATKAEFEAQEAAKPKPPSTDKAALDRTIGDMQGAIDTINLLTRQFNETLSGKGLAKSTLEYLPSQEKGAINATGAGLADVGLAVFKIPGAGAQSDKDAERFVAANQPSTTDFDYTFLGKIYNLRRRLDAKAKAMGLPPIQWVEPNERSARDYLALPEDERRNIGLREIGTFRDVPPELVGEGAPPAAGGERPSGLSIMPEPGVDRSAPLPGRINEAQLQAAPEGATLGVSDINREIASRLQKAFDENASAEDLQALAIELTGKPLNTSEVDAAIRYRDQYIQQGGRGPSGAIVAPAETPLTKEQLSEVEKANSAARAFLAKSGEALAFGQAPNITELFDPAKAEEQRMALDLYRQASPTASTLGSIAGSVVPTAAGAFGLTRLGMAPTRAAALSDVLYGGTVGAGENPDNPLGGAVVGGTTAALGSLAGRYLLSPAVEAAARTGGNLLPRLTEKYAPSANAIRNKPTYTQRTLAEGVGDVGEAEARLADAARLGLPMGVADVSTQSQALGRQAARRSPEAAAAAEATTTGRAAERVDRLKDSITQFVGNPIDDLRRAEDEIEQAADNAAGPLYDKALSRAAPIDDKLDAMLDTTLGRKGLQQAYVYAESRGVDPRAIGFDLDDQGLVKLVQKPSWETLHYIRKGLQREIDQYRDPVTRSLDTRNPDVDNAQNFLRRYDRRLDALNPDYAAARTAWSQYIAPRDYLELGLKALDPNTPPADVQRTLARINAMPDATPEQAALKEQSMDVFRRGFATAQRTAVDNARSSGTDPYAVIFGTPRQRQKLDLIAPGAADFTKSAELEGRMLTTERTVRPSPAAQGRAEAEAGLTAGDLAGVVGETLLTGMPSLSSANIAGQMLQPGRISRAYNYLGDKSRSAAKRATEIAPTLFDTDPSAALASMKSARQMVDEYRAGQKPFQTGGTYTGGLLGTAAVAEGAAPEQYDVPPQPLSEETLLTVVYGPGSKVAPDGSVVKKDGTVVPPEIARKEIADTARLVTPYYGPR